MTNRERIFRVVVGLIAVALVLSIGFALVLQVIPTWGATSTEIAAQLPGDELISNPTVNWTHAITIDAPIQQVWGWIAQMGERRGAFYSYTFIENQMGNGDVYHNAARIVPEWQNPRPGDVLIGGALPMSVYQVEPGKRMIGFMDAAFQWMWAWHLEALNPNQTRLIVRMRIQMPPGASNPIVDNGIGLGAFVMEQGMLQGIQARAEGSVPPPYSESLGIALWLAAFAAGIVAAIFFIIFKEGIVSLALGLGALGALLVFTFLQPGLGVYMSVDVLLWAGLLWVVLDQRARHVVSLTASDDGSTPLKLKPTA